MVIPEAKLEADDHVFSIRESHPILKGRYLELIGDYKVVHITPPVPARSVSLDMAVSSPGGSDEYAGGFIRAEYTKDGFGQYVYASKLHYTFTAPQGKLITRITLNPINRHTADVDNIEFD
ncbi:hypothetical protein D3C81_1890460 [compost metagenome]